MYKNVHGSYSDEYLDALAGVGRAKADRLAKRNGAGREIVESILTDGANERLFAMCAEPECAAGYIADFVGRSLGHDGVSVDCLCLAGMSNSEAVERVVKFAHGANRVSKKLLPGKKAVCIVEDVPALDESELRKMTRALTRIEESGRYVILTMLPESQQILADLPPTRTFRSRDLLLGTEAKRGRRSYRTRAILEVTGGLLGLARAALDANADEPEDFYRDPGFIRALSTTVVWSLRDALLDEERAMRYSMLMLGHGDFGEVREILGGLDQALVDDLCADAPLYGADAESQTFKCVAVDTVDGLKAVMSALDDFSDQWRAIPEKVCRRLCERQEYERAAALLELMDDDSTMGVFQDWPAELLDGGDSELAHDVLTISDPHTPQGRLSRVVLTSVLGNADEQDEALSNAAETGLGDQLGGTVGAVVRARMALRGMPREPEGVAGGVIEAPTGAVNHIERRYETHARFLTLLSMGMVREAMELVSGSPDSDDSGLHSACLLKFDALLAEMLLGEGAGDEGADGLLRAEEVSLERGFECLSFAFDCVRTVPGILFGPSRRSNLVEEATAIAGERGDELAHIACLALASVVDARNGNDRRARSRLAGARNVAERLGMDFLGESLSLLVLAMRAAGGERVTSGEVMRACTWGSSTELVARALAVAVEPKTVTRDDLMDGLEDSECPEGLLWLVSVLTTDFGEVSSRLWRVLPPAWQERLGQARRVAQGSIGDVVADAADLEPGTDDGTDADGAVAIRITLLGGFGLSVGGRSIPKPKIERRRAKPLLMLLASTRGHQLPRFTIMETIWPEYDYGAGRQRVYEATSVLRAEFDSLGCARDSNPIISSRLERSMGLNGTVVSCDVDEFEDVARSALLARGGAREILMLASRAEVLYRGDLAVPAVDGTGLFEQRRLELRSLFVDVMVLASAMALEEGQDLLAVHYAQSACNADDLREDAELCLVKALEAAGRSGDVHRSYEEFSERMLRATGFPPSKSLREIVAEATKGGRHAKRRKLDQGGGKRDQKDDDASDFDDSEDGWGDIVDE